jgi:hypothetical protein
LLLLFLVAIAVAKNDGKQTSESDASVSDIKNYRKMIRVNREPMDMVESTKTMCARPRMIYGPHYDPGVVYYINEIARTGFKAFANTKMLPLGSIIVKEKQERRSDDSVQIITVMRKTRPDLSEESWDYKMYDTKSWAQIDSAKHGPDPNNRATCIDCHRRYQHNDYVSDKGFALLTAR